MANPLAFISSLISPVATLVDEIHTSDEERLQIMEKNGEQPAHAAVSDGEAFGSVRGTHPAQEAVVQTKQLNRFDDDRFGK